ncbi:FadD3 family acyl-CoA ligase [Pseudonocardia acaciae]|uniref:FadD3 family acyl-CoA ligase n=1 Tax=Pseudonocardia acaciae TaxID=551276 RepID=UPI000561C2B6|nr:FadD3 family acyl-CoA ligase [Pseudonocardia acaciae]
MTTTRGTTTHGSETVPAVLRRTAEAHGAVEAVVDGPTRLTYAELLAEVERVAAGLLARELEPGDAVAIWAPNSARWMLAALACFHLGLTVIPVNTRYRGAEAHDLLARARARALFVEDGFLDQGYLAMLRAAGPLPSLDTVVTLDRPGDWEELVSASTPPARVEEAARAVTPQTRLQVMFTSGTTGRPKGVPHTHGQVVRLFTSYSDTLGLRAGDRYLLVNPFFHSFGLMAGILSCVIQGATALPMRRLDTAEALELIERERVTGVPGPPTLYASLMNDPARAGRDLSSLRLAVTGASVVPSELIRRMRADLGFTDILTAYGLTEATGAVTMCRLGDPDAVVEATSGRAIDGVEVAIAPVGGGADGSGEILVRGYNVMGGYFEDPAATAAAIDPDGWLHTGDIGRLDEAGYLRITDRLGDMFIVGGFNVYPAEVERLLNEHPGVSESAVIGVPDERLGEVGRAFVVRRHGHEVSEPELLAWIRGRLANFKVPRSVVFLPELPRAATGKVAKSRLREHA